MIILKTLAACLAVAAVMAVLHWSGVAAHDHADGAPDAHGNGCQFCPSAGACLSAQPARPICANQEDRP